MGTTQVKLFKTPSQSFVLQSAHFRQTPFPPCRYEEQAQQLFSRLVNELAEKEGVIEQLKATNQMKWVQKMNNIRNRAAEIVNSEVVFICKNPI